ncbi:unnamed protein product [Caenorhabditis brenneri]
MKLLNLPFLVKELVFEMMNKGERLDLALTSKRMKRTIQATRLKCDYDVTIDFQVQTIVISGVREYIAALGSYLHRGPRTRMTSFNGEETVLVEMNGSSFQCYWETDEQLHEGFFKIIVYLLSKLDINFISNLNLMVERSALRTLHFLNNKEILFGNVFFIGNGPENIYFGDIIFSYNFLRRVNSRFTTFAALPVFVIPTFPNSASLNVQSVHIDDSRWLNISHLLSFEKARDIELHQSSLEDKDLQEFLKSWSNGNFQELKRFEISTDHILSIKEITMDLVDQKRISISAEREKAEIYGRANLRGVVRIYFRDKYTFIFETRTN